MFNNLKIGRVLGNGAEGEVYQAKYDGNQRVAIKIYKFDTSDEDKMYYKLQKLINEFNIFKNIHHSNLVS